MPLRLLGIAVVAGAAMSANAFEFRSRWVERIGNVDVVLPGDGASADVSDFAQHRFRLQFGVFDDAAGQAPPGGFVGWNVGTLRVSGFAGNSDDRRTPGRLAPFVFSASPNANGNPPLPGGDPFTFLTDLDVTLGTQSPFWGCDASGNPHPQPAAVIRGHNTFVSVYEITTDPGVTAASYSITAAGNLIAATEWREVGTPFPPDCGDPGDPMDDILGSVTYAPFPTDPVAFERVLNLIVPGPGAAGVLGAGGLLLARRRR